MAWNAAPAFRRVSARVCGLTVEVVLFKLVCGGRRLVGRGVRVRMVVLSDEVGEAAVAFADGVAVADVVAGVAIVER